MPTVDLGCDEAGVCTGAPHYAALSPEAPPIPEGPDEVVVLVIPKSPQRRKRRTHK